MRRGFGILLATIALALFGAVPIATTSIDSGASTPNSTEWGDR
ncbi:hypothetical protein [Cryptosporangium arvum]|uniref:Uncharacterized protein n=1 Tax=Cryptosporangium arvum DSM 44712 TaxID=927661 RepID=A0A010YHU2_9ACTN|nr:hypothetical protein [Cryptosporangium arvum]EXG79845.1 hypothetical protein CryarDRAFT_0891 [Cryptosporangium arvum DSM 44712]